MFFPVSAWFTAFVVTVVIEAPIVWWFVRGREPGSTAVNRDRP